MDTSTAIDNLLNTIQDRIDAVIRRVSNLEANEGNSNYSLQPSSAQFSPADGNNYFIGVHPSLTPQTTSGSSKLYISKSGKIIRASIMWFAAGAAGSNESISLYIRLNNTTDTLIATISDTNATKLFANTSLSINVVAGDYIEIKMISPTWGTNPTNVNIGGVVHVQ